MPTLLSLNAIVPSLSGVLLEELLEEELLLDEEELDELLDEGLSEELDELVELEELDDEPPSLLLPPPPPQPVSRTDAASASAIAPEKIRERSFMLNTLLFVKQYAFVR